MNQVISQLSVAILAPTHIPAGRRLPAFKSKACGFAMDALDLDLLTKEGCVDTFSDSEESVKSRTEAGSPAESDSEASVKSAASSSLSASTSSKTASIKAAAPAAAKAQTVAADGDATSEDSSSEGSLELSEMEGRKACLEMDKVDGACGADITSKAYESWEAHVGTGGCGGKKACARCRWVHFKRTWQKALAVEVGGERLCPIIERPAAWGGPWAIGCSICAQAGRAGAYAKLEVRTLKATQIANLKNHCEGDPHVKALKAIQKCDPDVVPAEDEVALSDWGPDIPGAPCGATFVHAYTTFKHAVSNRGSGFVADMVNVFASDDEKIDRDPKKLKAALECCAEVIRRECRAQVFAADDISFQADGRAGEQLMTAVATSRATLKSLYFVLGVKEKVTGGCEKLLKSTEEICREFSTELNGDRIDDVYCKLIGPQSKVRAYEADGASDEQGTGRLLKVGERQRGPRLGGGCDHRKLILWSQKVGPRTQAPRPVDPGCRVPRAPNTLAHSRPPREPVSDPE